MAVNFGVGIRLNSGIKVVGDAGGGAVTTPNSIVDATINENGYDWYGAYDYTTGYVNFGISDFGTVTSDYFYAIVYQGDGFNTSQNNIALNDGSYTGFTVTNGAIDGDLQSYPRVFTFGGQNYTFTRSAQGYYFAYGDPLNVTTQVGSTITTVYNPAIQPSLTPNSIIVGQYTTVGPTTYYGADKTGALGYGTIVSDYLTEVSNANSSTNIRLAPGTYTGFTVDSNGLIDGDNSTARTFSVNGVNAVFTVAGSAPNYLYTNMGNPFSLQIANLGITLAAAYDPAAQPVPGSGEFVSGNMTVGNGGPINNQYGWQQYSYGSVTFPNYPTGPLVRIYYESGGINTTTIEFFSGTYGATVVNGTLGTIDGETSVTVTIDGVTEIGTLFANSSSCRLEFVGDVFSLQSKNGQTLAVTMVAGAVTPGEVASGTITVGADGPSYGYSNGSGSPPFGSSAIAPAMVAFLAWINNGSNGGSGSTGVRLTSGTYGSVVVDGSLGTVDGETQLTVVVDGISQTGTLSTAGGGGSYVELPFITGDPYGLQAKNGQTLTVSVIAGASGGGGGTTYTQSGNWGSSGFMQDGPGWRVSLGLSGPGTAAGLVSALNALTVGSTFSITDNTSLTQSVTVSSVSGQPFNEFSYVVIYVNTPSPTPPSSWPGISSITL